MLIRIYLKNLQSDKIMWNTTHSTLIFLIAMFFGVAGAAAASAADVPIQFSRLSSLSFIRDSFLTKVFSDFVSVQTFASSSLLWNAKVSLWETKEEIYYGVDTFFWRFSIETYLWGHCFFCHLRMQVTWNGHCEDLLLLKVSGVGELKIVGNFWL